MTNPNLHLVEIAQHHNGKPITFHALALRVGESWLWYPDPAVQIGEGQRVVRWKRVVDVEGWEDGTAVYPPAVPRVSSDKL